MISIFTNIISLLTKFHKNWIQISIGFCTADYCKTVFVSKFLSSNLAEKNEVLIQKKLSEVEMENEKLVEGKKYIEKTLESVTSEKNALEERLAQSLKAFDDLKQEKEGIVMQKENIEKNRADQLLKVADLEKYVQQLVATVASLEKNDKMLREEKKERDEAFEGLLGEKGLIEQKLVDSGKMVEELKREKEEIVAEKNKIEKNRADQLLKVADLSKYVEQLGATIASKDKNDVILRKKVDEMEKGYTEALEKQEVLKVELDSERKKVKEIVEAKVGIERTKSKMENELGELRMSVSKLEKSYKYQMDANKHLKSEVGSLNDSLNRDAAEKSEIQKELELKKKEESSLSLKVKELQKSMVDTMKGVEKQKKGTSSLSIEMKELETRSEMLINEKSLLEKILVEAEKGNQIMCVTEDEEKEATVESDIDMKKIEKDIRPFASELESIRKAFKNKGKKMEEMIQQIENLNKSAKKNSNIWALVSSAITILAAASATYIARGR
ncbi:hypothetical protein MKX01_038294 [Papaver californicum]|nr:hypothetical protein MKX01_038294 [Papaver californicum]